MRKLEIWTIRISAWFNVVAMVALSAMLAIVAADIIGSKFFSRPVSGAMDFSSLLSVIIIGFSMTQTYLLGRHIKVDFMMALFPEVLKKIFRSITASLCFVFFVLIVWRMFICAHNLQVYGEKSLTVKIPIYPFAYALAVAFIPMLLALPIQLYKIWKGTGE